MNANQVIDVLLVDDEDRFRVTTAATLKRRGFRVTAVGSGYEAVEEIRDHDVDVVVLDAKMPGIDGHETLREIKKLKPNVEVIMLTGYGSLGSALEGWHEGVFAYLTKPSSIDFLAHRIQEACNKKRGTGGHGRRVRDVMEPLSVFISTIRQEQSVAEAIGAMHRFFDSTIAATKHKETLLRSILVTDDNDKVVGIISLADLLCGLQPPCLRLQDDRPTEGDAVILDSPAYVSDFSTMVQEMASKKVRDLMPKKSPTIDTDADLIEAANKLISLRTQSILAVEKDMPVGVVRDSDIFLEMVHIIRNHRSQPQTS